MLSPIRRFAAHSKPPSVAFPRAWGEAAGVFAGVAFAEILETVLRFFSASRFRMTRVLPGASHGGFICSVLY